MRDAPHVVPEIDGQRAPRRADATIAELAAVQHGVVARRQLARLGIGADAIDHRVERERLHAVHRGVYAVGHRRLTRTGAWMAAVLAGGDGAVLSHRSAAALWGIRDGSPRDVHITAPRHRRGRAGLVMHETRLPGDEVTVHDAIPVTTPARTILDLAALVDEHRLARAAERAEALRLPSPTSLAELVARHPRRPGVAAIRRLLEAGRIVETTTRSDLEDRFLALLEAERLPRPLVNAPLDLPNRTLEADCAWPAERLVVELDGFAAHATRAAFERDRSRDRPLQAAGWRVVRITWRQLDERPGEIAAELRALLGGARHA